MATWIIVTPPPQARREANTLHVSQEAFSKFCADTHSFYPADNSTATSKHPAQFTTKQPLLMASSSTQISSPC